MVVDIVIVGEVKQNRYIIFFGVSYVFFVVFEVVQVIGIFCKGRIFGFDIFVCFFFGQQDVVIGRRCQAVYKFQGIVVFSVFVVYEVGDEVYGEGQ